MSIDTLAATLDHKKQLAPFTGHPFSPQSAPFTRHSCSLHNQAPFDRYEVRVVDVYVRRDNIANPKDLRVALALGLGGFVWGFRVAFAIHGFRVLGLKLGLEKKFDCNGLGL